MEICDAPSWERLIIESDNMIADNLRTYLTSQEFKTAWKDNGYLAIGECVRNVFPIKTPTTELIEEVFIGAAIAQLNVMRGMFAAFADVMPLFQYSFECLPIKLIVRQTMERGSHVKELRRYTLYERLGREYKELSDAAETIQIHWRRCITDPSYSVCRKRLQKELRELAD